MDGSQAHGVLEQTKSLPPWTHSRTKCLSSTGTCLTIHIYTTTTTLYTPAIIDRSINVWTGEAVRTAKWDAENRLSSWEVHVRAQRSNKKGGWEGHNKLLERSWMVICGRLTRLNVWEMSSDGSKVHKHWAMLTCLTRVCSIYLFAFIQPT